MGFRRLLRDNATYALPNATWLTNEAANRRNKFNHVKKSRMLLASRGLATPGLKLLLRVYENSVLVKTVSENSVDVKTLSNQIIIVWSTVERDSAVSGY